MNTAILRIKIIEGTIIDLDRVRLVFLNKNFKYFDN